MAQWFYRPGWTPAPEPEPGDLDGPWLVLADSGGVGTALAGLLRGRGVVVTLVGHDDLVPADPADHRRLLADLAAPPRRLVHLWGLDDGTPEELEERGLHALIALAQACGTDLPGQPLRLDLVACGTAEVVGDEALHPSLAAAVGAARVLPHEDPDLEVRAIDMEPAAPAAAAERLLAELVLGGSEPVVALRGAGRWVPTVTPLPLPQAPVAMHRNAVVMITGAFGGVGSALARDLAGEPGMRLVLLGRHALPERAAWDDLVAAGDPLAPRLALVRELEAAGAEVMTAGLELADGAALDAVVRDATARFGPITGVIHAAGLADLAGVVQNRARADTERVLAPKIAGTRALEAALAGQPLAFLVLCSTLGSFLPAAKFGQVAYAAANEYLDLAAADIAQRTGWRCVTVNWDDWVEAGMTVEAHRAWGIAAPTATDGLTPREGAAALRRILAGRHHRVAVSVRDLPAMIAEADARFDPLATPLPPKARDVATHDLSGTGTLTEQDGDALVAELAAAFRRVLDDPGAGSDDSFFERGGHSLLAMRLLAHVRERFGVRLGLAAIFDHPTPRGFAAHLRTLRADAERHAPTTDHNEAAK